MNEWTEVFTEIGYVDARDFLDGVLVRDDVGQDGFRGATFCPGWKVRLQGGDMDHNMLVKR